MTAASPPSSAFDNRLRKNLRHRRKWAQREKLTAFRLYDRDIPEYPVTVDWYAGRVLVVEFPSRRAIKGGAATAVLDDVVRSVRRELQLGPSDLYIKTHLPKVWGKEQYGRVAEGTPPFTVEEKGLRFWVNLGDYLDTGLFMDHRVTRARVREEAQGKDFLNLFAYTGSFSVYAGAGQARSTTSVDLSNTYCDWASKNLALNHLTGPSHRVIRADVLAWLADQVPRGPQYDLVVLDPPSFSSSKKMQGTFNIQRDHPRLIRQVLSLIRRGGVLYFSTNFLGFQLDERCLEGLSVQELTPHSIPEDFHHRSIHRCWRIGAGGQGANR